MTRMTMMLFMPTFRWAKTVRISDLHAHTELRAASLRASACKNLLAFLTLSTKVKIRWATCCAWAPATRRTCDLECWRVICRGK